MSRAALANSRPSVAINIATGYPTTTSTPRHASALSRVTDAAGLRSASAPLRLRGVPGAVEADLFGAVGGAHGSRGGGTGRLHVVDLVRAGMEGGGASARGGSKSELEAVGCEIHEGSRVVAPTLLQCCLGTSGETTKASEESSKQQRGRQGGAQGSQRKIQAQNPGQQKEMQKKSQEKNGVGSNSDGAGQLNHPKDFSDYPQVTCYNCGDPGHHKQCARELRNASSANLLHIR